MPSLVPIPWQPHLLVAPSYLARLEKASDLAGHEIYLNSIKSITGRYLSAWRALEEAIYVFDLYKNHGGPVASDPYKGKRYHLRGAGGDIRDKADRKYMLAAGFLPDPDEWWHFSDPNWANMPIIAINAQTAGHGTTSLGEEDLDATQNAALISARDEAKSANERADWANTNADKARTAAEASLTAAQNATTTAEWANVNADKARVASEAALAILQAGTSGKGGTVSIDYDLLANKVADKLAARLVS